jgi:hypothetical protein
MSLAAQDRYEAGAEYWKPRPYKITAVKTVHISKNGAWSNLVSSDETPDVCAKFVLTQETVKDFFCHARRASSKEYGHDLDMSRCFASGKLVFANGDKGEWQIDRERRGVVTLEDGRNLYFYCPNCKNEMFGE